MQYSAGQFAAMVDVNGNQIPNIPSVVGDTVTEMYSYTSVGQMACKRLRVQRMDEFGNAATADLNASWAYNNEGKETAATYTGSVYSASIYNYSYNTMAQLTGMTQTNQQGQTQPVVRTVTYNPAGQMTQMDAETRTYNSLGQLTGISNLTYAYPTGTNNGKISSVTDAVTGETVTYAYDSLNRLISPQ